MGNETDNNQDMSNDLLEEVASLNDLSSEYEYSEEEDYHYEDDFHDKEETPPQLENEAERDTHSPIKTMSADEIKNRLDRFGYAVVPNVLNQTEIDEYRSEFFTWFNNTPGLKNFHSKLSGNGIMKFHEVAHQRFAWLARTNPKIIDIFKDIWETDDLVTSFDGCCYYPQQHSDDPTCWIHTDQSSKKIGKHCVQSFVSFTENVERTLVLYHGSHHLHQDYFNLTGTETPNDWCVLDRNYLKGLEYRQVSLHVPAGSLVLWDSRVFHQNTCGSPECREERLIQYLCYLPRNHVNNTEREQGLRRECYDKRINTSHWPYPIRPVPLYPSWLVQEDSSCEFNINYDDLEVPKIEDLCEKIEKLI